MWMLHIIGPDGQLPNPEGAELTQMNYEFYPQALEHVIREVAKDVYKRQSKITASTFTFCACVISEKRFMFP